MAVVIPCYRVRETVLAVVRAVPPAVAAIYVVDDCCPEGSGRLVHEGVGDPRVRVLFNERNLGVGGATLAGFRRALEEGADVIVKIDGDGQMDPALLPHFVAPIAAGHADYTKGNRFFNLEDVAAMPRARLAGNAVLSFVAKLSGGYWNIFDPTNGYVAIHARVFAWLPAGKIDPGYFFETDMLFRLNTLRAVVADIPMRAVYGGAASSLRLPREAVRFAAGHARNFARRIFYNYFLRDFNFASLELVLGSLLVLFGGVFGAMKWWQGSVHDVFASSGTVMLSALPVILGAMLLLAFIGHDIQSVPRDPIHGRLPRGPARHRAG
ncbi:MAG TPA: glycosyltransferase family 2 protein [bacterium]